MSAELTLYVDSFYISPYAMCCFVALEEKLLPYTCKEVSLPDAQQHQPTYLARTNRIPALQHGDYWLAESQAITEYLAETFPFPHHPRLFPADLKERGICRELMSWVRSDLIAIREERSTETIWYGKPTSSLSAVAECAKAKLIATAERVVSGDRTTLFAEWCIADTDLAMMLQRLHLNGDTLPDKLVRYAEANWARPSVQKWCDMKRKPFVAY